MSIRIEDLVVRNILPRANNTYDIGSSSLKFNDIYATYFRGALKGNADTATKWANASTFTIGLTGKSVQGDGNVSWSLAEIGAVPAAGGTITGTLKIDNSTSSGYVKLFENGEGGTIQVVGKSATYIWEMDAYNDRDFRIFTNGSGNYKFFTFAGDTGNLTAVSFTGSLVGNASTASKWQTARTITIGNTGKSVDGSGNVSWTLSEIGAVPKSGGTMTGDLEFAAIGSWPVVSGETYPINSKGIWWSGSSDSAGIFYRITGADNGNQIFQLGDDTSPNWIFTYSNGTVAAKIHNGGITASNFIGNTNGYTWDLATHNTADTWLFVLNGTKIQHRLATDFCAASGSMNYVKVYNSGNIGDSRSVTMNDLAKSGFAAGMIHSATDNPTGSAKWVHALSMCWSEGSNTDWISQLAFGVAKGDGLWYRTNPNECVGKPWKRVLDSSNYSSYALPITGGTLNGNLNVGGKVELWSDGEGGNIRLTSPNGSQWSIDALNNSLLRFIWAETSVPFTFSSDGILTGARFNGVANEAWTADKLRSYNVTPTGGNAKQWTRALHWTLGNWANRRIVLVISSRHQGNGILTIALSTLTNNATLEYDIRYYGTTTQYHNGWIKPYYNYSTGVFTLWVKDGDYSNANYKVLHIDDADYPVGDMSVASIPSDAGTELWLRNNSASQLITSNYGLSQPSGASATGDVYFQLI